MPDFKKHISVLYEELIESLRFFETGKNIIVDATLGLGGHAAGVIQKLGRGDIFIGLDCDETNLKNAKQHLLLTLSEKQKEEQPTVYCISSNFRDIKNVIQNISSYIPINELKELKELKELTCIYADLGVSSVHFDTADRGFSFRFDGPLDMRLDISQGKTAADIINTLPYDKMAEMFRIYGDEPKAGIITKRILEARKLQPLSTTEELTKIITGISRDALPRVFQALRIAVNDEFGALETLLSDATKLLIPGGSISIISFHSGEDRIVKNFFRNNSHGAIDQLTGQEITSGELEIVTKKPLTPSHEEIMKNPRSRSALLRIAIRK